MAAELLLMLLRMNLAAGAAILLVLALRKSLSTWFGARIAYMLWLVVPIAAFAMFLPPPEVSVETIIAGTRDIARAPVTSGAPVAVEWPLPVSVIPTAFAVDNATPLLAAWLVGALAMLGLLVRRQRLFVTSLGRLRREPGSRRILRANASGVGPAVIGAFSPRLILPRDFEACFDRDERSIVLAHERAHITGGDTLINAMAALLQCLGWFNPLVHVAVHCLRIDQELACDAVVVARFPNARRRYAETMLKSQLGGVTAPFGCHWPPRNAHPLKERIKMLKRDLPGPARFGAGLVTAGVLSLAVGCIAWAVQPAVAAPQAQAPVARQGQSPAQASLGRKLVVAIQSDDVVGCAALIEAGADVNYHRRADPTPLIAAVWRRNLALVTLLLDNGADVNLAAAGDGNALIAASARGYTDIAAELIARGADVNANVLHDETPLMNAARAGKLDTVMYLVEHGADVNFVVLDPALFSSSPQRRTALGQARFFGHAAVADYLKSKGAT
jgi:beta-lactamase regulating signal transducer with metallopeptidase domain